MPAPAFIVNRALQSFGTRTTVTDAELAANSTNEAIQANLIAEPLRNELIRMAPWNCATNYANLVLISSVPGTPENTSPGTMLWQKGQPYPPWAYEYQWPMDCIRPLFIVPQSQTGFSGGIPITTAVTGGAPAFWQGPPVRFKVGIDQFFAITTPTSIVSPGAGYVVGEVVTLAIGPVSSPPIGAPARLSVTTVDGSGGVTGFRIIGDFVDASTGRETVDPVGGNYFAPPTSPLVQGSSTGAGTGLSISAATLGPIDRRIILTDQELATLCYLKNVTDPNTMDSLFIDAWSYILGSGLIMALSGDKALANNGVAKANQKIVEARNADGNEGLTVNDVTPDWIRTRGADFSRSMLTGPYSGFEWGNLFPVYG
jgi:hypothetical protein